MCIVRFILIVPSQFCLLRAVLVLLTAIAIKFEQVLLADSPLIKDDLAEILRWKGMSAVSATLRIELAMWRRTRCTSLLIAWSGSKKALRAF